ncbi:MAG: metal ABC transporter substrate-binding protein [Polyangiaceae bacterium]|nr:metal ABC transporter substrate-binding protein [Polyangiaceae bacterium]
MAAPLPLSRHLIALVAIVAMSSLACSHHRTSPVSRLRVAVSIFPIYDLTRRIAGPDADVTLLLAPGRSEHTFDPTPKDVETVASTELAVVVGLGLDPWMNKLVHDAAPRARLLAVGEHVPTLVLHARPVEEEDSLSWLRRGHHEHEHGAVDPHVWLDPRRARAIVAAIARELALIDASHADAYRDRAAIVDASLAALDDEVEARTKRFRTRAFITFHGSFGYFADRYDLVVLAVLEPYPGSQPSGAYVRNVLHLVAEKNIDVLFREPQLDSRPAKILANEAHVALGVLDPIGGADATDSYEKMIRFNVVSLENYLGKEAFR